MTETAHSDAELLAQARGGDEAAFTELYVRHHAAARRLAAAYPRAGDPDDLVNGAFERILGALRRGAGPDEAFRAYLFVTLRRLAADQITRTHDEPVDEVPEPVRAEEHTPALDLTDRQLVVSAYESLPERWQAVLWQTAVEGRQPRDLADALGMSANAAAALAYRAREKLRQAYLQAHLQTAPRPQCEPHRSRLGAYVRDGLSRRDRGTTDGHLDDCGACRSLVAELVDVNQILARSLFPLFTATATQAGLAGAAAGAGAGAAGGGVAGGGVALMGKRMATKARSNPGVVAGVVAAVAVVAFALIAMQGGDETALPPPEEPPVEEPSRPAPPPRPQTPPPSPPAEPVAMVRTPTSSEPPPAVETTTTTAPSTTTAAPVVPPLVPPPPTSTSSPPTDPPPPPSIVEWVPGSSELQITLTNHGDETIDGMLVTVDLRRATVSGLPTNCGVAVAVIWSATCSVLPIEPGETRVVTVPVTMTGDGASARTYICETGFLALNCVLDPPTRITTPIT